MPDAAGCHACGAGVDPLIDLGPQPLSNRFPRAAGEDEQRWPLALVVCTRCALVQLADPVPADELRPRVDWIAYREPDAHLDEVAARVTELPGAADATVLGIGDYDGPLVERLRGVGIDGTTIDWRADLGAPEPLAGVETLQERLTVPRARELARARGRAEIVSLRYVVEHAHDVGELLAALRELTVPGGHVIIEVPDCEPAFERADYGALWEEHVLYFTGSTLASTLAAAGFETVAVMGPAQVNAIVSIARMDPSAVDRQPNAVAAADDRERAASFAARLPRERERWRELLGPDRAGRVAMLGAGHTGIVWANVLGLGEQIYCVIDDHPEKQGLATPGARLPIVPSTALTDDAIETCILAVAPDAEDKVVRANEDWGGRFMSIAPGSPRHPFDPDPVAA